MQISFGIVAVHLECNGWIDINCVDIELCEGAIIDLTVSVGPFSDCLSSGMIIVKFNNTVVQNTMHQVVMQDAPIIKSPVREVARQIRPPSVPVIDKSDVYRPNLQSISMVASLKLFRLQQQLAGIETESDESSDEWKPVQQLYNPIAKQNAKKKQLVLADMQHKMSMSS